jgi:HAD superfamily hydrolase (TIGR01490 family)
VRLPGARWPRRADPHAVDAGEASAAVAAAIADSEEGGSPSDPRAAAFFDVDNTMLRGASLYYLARGFVQRGFLDGREIARFARDQLKFRLVGAEDVGLITSAKDAALALAAGQPVAALARVGEEIFDEVMMDRIYPGTRALAQRHLDAGQRVWLVTATPVEIATLIAKRLGLTGALGTVSEIVDGCYTGRLVGETLHGPAKAEAVRALAKREGLDLRRCAAYSDSANDIPMLSIVGTPYAVNPDRGLRRHAREHGWQVRDFRSGRIAARRGVSTAGALGAGVAVTAIGLALRRRAIR